MTFFRFAIHNVRRNERAYAAYFLSNVFAIVIFFIYATLAFHPDLSTKEYIMTRDVVFAVQAADSIIFSFMFFFILYPMGTILKGHNKEIGILMMLGISNRQLMVLIFLENVLLGLASIGGGVVLGLICTKLFLMLVSAAISIPELPFYFPTQALVLTCASFLALFVLISLMATLFLRNRTILGLLQGTSRPKPKLKASLVLTLFSVFCLVTGYALASTFNVLASPAYVPFLVILLVIVGTYFLYTQASVFLIHVLQQRRAFYWHGTHLLWLSDLAYRMRDNAHLLCLVTIILSSAFTATSSLATYSAHVESRLQQWPFAFTIAATNEAFFNRQNLRLEQAFQQQRVNFTTTLIPFAEQDSPPDETSDRKTSFVLFSLSNYNRLAQAVHVEPLTVQPGEVVALPADIGEPPRTVTFLARNQQIPVVQKEVPHVLNEASLLQTRLVVTDAEYVHLSQGMHQGRYAGYATEQWLETVALSETASNEMYQDYQKAAQSDSELDFIYTSRVSVYMSFHQLPALAMFIGLFIAVIFLVAAGGFLYFRLYSDLKDYQTRYKALAKIGLSEQEMRSSATLQMVLLFFIPFVVAVPHTFFALLVVQNNIHNVSIGGTLVATIGGFFVLQLVYFFITRAQYLYQLKKAIV